MAGEDDRSSQLRNAGPYLNVGFTFVGAIGGLAYVGYRLDERWGSDPWLTLAGAVLGMIVGFVSFFRTVMPPQRKP